jgi:hypothetical protein
MRSIRNCAKNYLIIILFTFFCSNLLHARDITQKQIRDMIVQIQQSDPKERYKKMNDFKKLLRQMNTQNRLNAINELRGIDRSIESSTINTENTVNTDRTTTVHEEHPSVSLPRPVTPTSVPTPNIQTRPDKGDKPPKTNPNKPPKHRNISIS